MGFIPTHSFASPTKFLLLWMADLNFLRTSRSVKFITITTCSSEEGEVSEIRYFKGSIDDIRIYDRALSADEIELLYRAESPNHFVDSAKDLEMIWVEPGTFTMGSPETESGSAMSPSTMSP